jgi:two-component system, sensor histidine kinase LadS
LAANNKEKQPALEEMSGLLNIGKNTCWDFRKKIKVTLPEKKKSLGITEVDSWDVLILD